MGPSDTPTKLTDLPKKTSIIMWPISWPTKPAAAPRANQAQSLKWRKSPPRCRLDSAARHAARAGAGRTSRRDNGSARRNSCQRRSVIADALAVVATSTRRLVAKRLGAVGGLRALVAGGHVALVVEATLLPAGLLAEPRRRHP